MLIPLPEKSLGHMEGPTYTIGDISGTLLGFDSSRTFCRGSAVLKYRTLNGSNGAPKLYLYR